MDTARIIWASVAAVVTLLVVIAERRHRREKELKRKATDRMRDEGREEIDKQMGLLVWCGEILAVYREIGCSPKFARDAISLLDELCSAADRAGTTAIVESAFLRKVEQLKELIEKENDELGTKGRSGWNPYRDAILKILQRNLDDADHMARLRDVVTTACANQVEDAHEKELMFNSLLLEVLMTRHELSTALLAHPKVMVLYYEDQRRRSTSLRDPVLCGSYTNYDLERLEEPLGARLSDMLQDLTVEEQAKIYLDSPWMHTPLLTSYILTNIFGHVLFFSLWFDNNTKWRTLSKKFWPYASLAGSAILIYALSTVGLPWAAWIVGLCSLWYHTNGFRRLATYEKLAVSDHLAQKLLLSSRAEIASACYDGQVIARRFELMEKEHQFLPSVTCALLRLDPARPERRVTPLEIG